VIGNRLEKLLLCLPIIEIGIFVSFVNRRGAGTNPKHRQRNSYRSSSTEIEEPLGIFL